MCSNDYGFHFYIDGVILIIVACLGVIGTTMTLIVLRKPLLQFPCKDFLTALCISDCIFLLMAIPYIALPALSCR